MSSPPSSTPTITYEFCDDDALPAELTRLSSLKYNQFYKLCPGWHQHSDGTTIPLGQPRCGDNSNYSFLITRPSKKPQEYNNDDDEDDGGGDEKIIIELSGGGACWDATTCALQSSQLTFPTFLNSFVGSSCASTSSFDILCSKTIDDIDLSEYTYIFIPYCTQDVHLGDASTATTAAAATPINDYDVQHVGGHNLFRTLSWVFENYPNPKHIFLTGCSAGATPLPVVYDLINMHYKNVSATRSGGNDDDDDDDAGATIDVIADSSVFLTPLHFLENYISNWNMATIMEKIDFDFDAFVDQTNFSVAILDHVLQRSKATDDVGYTFHDDDQVSQYYYKLMNGTSISELFENDSRIKMSSLSTMGRQIPMGPGLTPNNHDMHRRLNDADFSSLWWTELSSSISSVGVSHSNFQVYYMNGTGHCSYGLVRSSPFIMIHTYYSFFQEQK